FIMKFNTSLQLVYGTYLGGSESNVTGGPSETPKAITVDSSGNAYVIGQTSSWDFPTPVNAYAPAYAGRATPGFLAKLNASASSLGFSTYFAIVPTSIAVDGLGNVNVVGVTSNDGGTPKGAKPSPVVNGFAYLLVLNPSGTAAISFNSISRPAVMTSDRGGSL